MDSYLFFGYLSTVCILLPIAAGFMRISNSSLRHRLFLAYLIYGFLNDFLKPFIDSEVTGQWMYHIFVLVETVFLLWYMSRIAKNSLIRKILAVSSVVFLAFWLVNRFILEPGSTGYSPVYDMVSAIFVSCAAAYILITMAQQSDSVLDEPDFWFIAGTFLYFFCANFIFGLLGTDIYRSIWFIVNCLNIVVYVIFTKAFFSIRKPTKDLLVS